MGVHINQSASSSDTVWFHDSGKYTLFDDFSGYSDGAFSTGSGSNWTVTNSEGYSCNVSTGTIAGGSGKELILLAGSTGSGGWVKLATNNLPTNKDGYWFRMVNQIKPLTGDHIYLKFTINGTEYTMFDYGSNRASLTNAYNLASTFEINKNALTGNWDVYWGGITVVAGLTTITDFAIKVESTDAYAYLTVYVTDVRYKA